MGWYKKFNKWALLDLNWDIDKVELKLWGLLSVPGNRRFIRAFFDISEILASFKLVVVTLSEGPRLWVLDELTQDWIYGEVFTYLHGSIFQKCAQGFFGPWERLYKTQENFNTIIAWLQ